MNTQRTTTYRVEGLCCSDEEQLIRKRLGKVAGVQRVACNVVTQTVNVEHSCSHDELVRAFRDVGFTPRLHYAVKEHTDFWQKYSYLLFTSVSGVFLLMGLLLNHLGVSESVTAPLFAASMVSGGWRIALRALKAGKQLALDMNFLMTIATIGAASIGKWEEGAAVIFLFALSQLLERYSLDRSRRAIHSLMTLAPTMASVRRAGNEVSVQVDEVKVGERIVIRPGERIPFDGTVVVGESTANQAPITGESLPVQKRVGDIVYAGSLNERGTLEVDVTKEYNDTTLARIVRMVEAAQAERAPIQTFTERFSRYYTPAVLTVAVLIAAGVPLLLNEPFGDWFYRALVLLVIACPCALVISTPVTIVSGLTNAARKGILLKGGHYLEEIGKVNAIAFDKTGTLTEGFPRVTDVVPLNSLTPKRIIQIAAAVESKSEHHLAGAILQRAYEEGIGLDDVSYQHFESLTGRGVQARLNGTMYIVGSHDLIEEYGICSPQVEEVVQTLEAAGKTVIIVGTDREPIGVIAITDGVRRETSRVVRQLHEAGISKTIMVTGDNEATARAIATAAGIDEFHAGVMPDEKASRVKGLKERYGRVAMVGDGINDAPALAASTVGIAMGRSGTDVALETADVVLMKDDLSKIPYTISLSRKTLSIIKQNIVIALATKLVFLLLGVFGVATLWMAVLADDGATLVVILNGLRALRRPT